MNHVKSVFGWLLLLTTAITLNAQTQGQSTSANETRPSSDESRFFCDSAFTGKMGDVNASQSWHVTDAGLSRLRSYVLRGEIAIYQQNVVRSLNLDGTQISDVGLKQLEGEDGLVGLEELSLANSWITDEGLSSIAELKNLKQLNLGTTMVFDGGVSGVNVSEEAVKQLQVALPDCQIDHQRVAIELTENQLKQFALWSKIAVVRLNSQGEITSLWMRRGANFTTDYRESLSEMSQLNQLVANAAFNSDNIESLSGLTNLRSLSLQDCKLNDSDLAALEQLTQLTVLDLSGTDIADNGLDSLASLTELIAVNFRATDIRTAGLQKLRKSHPNTMFAIDPWRVVDLPYHTLTINEDFELLTVGQIGYRKPPRELTKELQMLLSHPTLEEISLRHSDALTDGHLKIISRMSKLKVLDLGNTKITSEGVKYLHRLKQLEKLNLWHTKITGDGGLSALEMTLNLRTLELDETKIDDTALPSIAQLESLRRLELWHTDVTSDGVDKLRDSLPDLEIMANPKR